MALYRPRLSTDDIIDIRTALVAAIERSNQDICEALCLGVAERAWTEIHRFADLYVRLHGLLGPPRSSIACAAEWRRRANATLEQWRAGGPS